MRVGLFVLYFVLLGTHVVHAGESAGSPSQFQRQADQHPRARDVISLPADREDPVLIPRFTKAPVIDGRLTDEAWKGAAVLKNFFQVQPGDNIPPSQPTEVLL